MLSGDGAARCIATAQRIAATALPNATISPSPVERTSRPSWAAIAPRSAVKAARRAASACSSPSRPKRDAEPASPQNRTATKDPSMARPIIAAPARACSSRRVTRGRPVHPGG